MKKTWIDILNEEVELTLEELFLLDRDYARGDINSAALVKRLKEIANNPYLEKALKDYETHKDSV